MIVKSQIDMQDPAQTILNEDEQAQKKIHLEETVIFFVLHYISVLMFH